MRIAVAQIAPRFLDRDATLGKVVASVGEAGRAGAGLVAFGEALVPGYPAWLSRTGGARFEDPDQKRMHALYVDQAVDVGRGDLDPVCEAARAARCAVVLGIVERSADRGSSLFASRVLVDAAGSVLSTHRKLTPTHEERLAWAPGDAAGLVTHAVGEFTVGALNCWENWMPLARAALYAAGEDLHVMLWPGSERLTRDLTRFVARESRSYVVSAGAVLRAEDLPEDLPLPDALAAPGEVLYDGGSCVAGPDGEWIVEPVVGREELVLCDLDAGRVREERQSFDPAGHYARPEILRVAVDRSRHGTAERLDASSPAPESP